MAARGVIQVGVFEGSPCVEISAVDFDAGDPEFLIKGIIQAMAPGIDFIVIDSDLPWGSMEFDHGLMEVLHHSALSELRLWRRAQDHNDRWSTLPVHCVLDCTDLFYTTTDLRTLVEQLYNIGTHPEEVIIMDAPDTLSHMLLDEVLGRLHARHGFLYVPEDKFLSFVPVVANACTRWSLRRM